MKLYVVNIIALLFVCLLLGCKQKISIKETDLTGINPLSYTDVVYKSNRDTVLVSRFDGRITEIVNHDNHEERLIIDLQDEVYSLAYNSRERLIYAATLNTGIVVIDEQEAKIEKILPLKSKWAFDVHYNPKLNILATSDYDDNAYLWDVNDNYSALSIPAALANMKPKAISDSGIIYFDGNSVVGRLNIKENTVMSLLNLPGKIAAVDSGGNLLALSYEKFLFLEAAKDSIIFKNKHPNWPIYVASRDTTVRAPISLYLTDAVLSGKYIYTSGIDHSIRIWSKENGELTKDLLGHRGTVSALAMTNDETQLASVDLRGGISFWELNNN